MEKWLDDIMPIFAIEHDCLLSRQGDITVAYKAELPEIFTLSNNEYEAFHQAWVKAVKVLPKHSILHKQDWFIDSTYAPDFNKAGDSFLSRGSERFFNERPYLDHSCYIFLTKKPGGRKDGSSLFSNLLRKSVVPSQALDPAMLQDFLDCCGQFRRILEDGGFVKMVRIKEADIYSSRRSVGLLEKYCFLSGKQDAFQIKDMQFSGDKIQVGNQHCRIYTLGIGSIVTYHKCIKELQEFGYIDYLPSYHPAIGSKVYLK